MSAQNNSEIRKMSDNQPILCIPGVFVNIKEDRIRRIFSDLNLGDVDRVDIIVPKRPIGSEEKENKFNRVFIHLIWNDTPSAVACRRKLMEGKDVKIIYDEPWFWKVSAYRPPAPKPRFQTQQPKVYQAKKATLELDFDTVAEVKYSGVIAPGLSIVVPPPVEEVKKCQIERVSKTRPQQRGEFGETVTDIIPDYGDAKAKVPTRKPKNKQAIATATATQKTEHGESEKK